MGWDKYRVAAVAGGVHTGATVQSVHAQTGIIGDGGELGGGADGFRLQHGIFREGRAGLLHFHSQSQILGTDHLHAEPGQDGAHLLQFARIVGGKYIFHFCSSNSL